MTVFCSFTVAAKTIGNYLSIQCVCMKKSWRFQWMLDIEWHWSIVEKNLFYLQLISNWSVYLIAIILGFCPHRVHSNNKSFSMHSILNCWCLVARNGLVNCPSSLKESHHSNECTRMRCFNSLPWFSIIQKVFFLNSGPFLNSLMRHISPLNGNCVNSNDKTWLWAHKNESLLCSQEYSFHVTKMSIQWPVSISKQHHHH